MEGFWKKYVEGTYGNFVRKREDSKQFKSMEVEKCGRYLENFVWKRRKFWSKSRAWKWKN